MITIKNQTEKVIVVENQHVHIEIPIGETVEIPKEKLQGDDYLFCRFFSARGEKTTVDFGMKNDGLNKRWYAYYENKSSFPMVTKLPIGNRDTLYLKEEMVDLRVILLFKVVVLRRITAASDQEPSNEEYQFFNVRDKKRFAKLMRKLLFFLPIALIARCTRPRAQRTQRILFRAILQATPACPCAFMPAAVMERSTRL